jgi:hypothetical protein
MHTSQQAAGAVLQYQLWKMILSPPHSLNKSSNSEQVH